MFHAPIDPRHAIHSAWCDCGRCRHAGPPQSFVPAPAAPPSATVVHLQAALLLGAAAAFIALVAVSLPGIAAAFGWAR